MDIKEYAQMMKYLTRPKETALDIDDEDYVEGRLNTLPENWWQTMPELEGAPDPATNIKELATGGVATPKRGLVDGPGSYAGEGLTVTEVNKYRKQGLTSNEIIKKLSESLDRNVNLTEYEKFLTANKSKLVPVISQKLTKEQIKAYDKATQKITKGKFKKFSDLDPKKNRELKVQVAAEGRRRLKGVPEGMGGPGVFKDVIEGEKTLSKSIRDILDASDKSLTLPDVRKELESKNISFNKNNLEGTVQRLKKTKAYKNKIASVPTADVVKKLRNVAFEKRKPFIQSIRDAFMADPDAAPEEIAEAMYGTKNFRNATRAQKLDYLKEMSRNVEQFVEVYGNPKTFKPITKDLKAIPVNKLGDILDNIARNTSAFGYGQTSVTKLQFQIADAARNFPPRTTMRLRESLQKKNFEVDEVVGRAATFERAPGYIEATQVIPKKINQLKGQRLDNRFSKVFGEALEGNFKNVDEYNTFAKNFAKQNKIDVPIIKIGEDLQPEKFVSNFTDFSPEAQKNIKQIAKDKGVVIQTKSKPLLSLINPKSKELKTLLASIKPTDTQPTILSKIKKAPLPSKVKNVLLATVGGYGAMTGADFLTSPVSANEAQASEVATPSGSMLPAAAATGTGAATLGTKTGRKILGKAFNVGFGPTGAAGLLYGFRPEDGYDLSRTGDRFTFEAEAALANPLVKGSLSVTDKIKTPLLRKVAERASLAGLSPAIALRLARVATPLGIASLGGEALYGYGKWAKGEIERVKNMTPEERAQYNAEQQEQMGVAAANGGLISLTRTTPPESEGGITSLNVKKK